MKSISVLGFIRFSRLGSDDGAGWRRLELLKKRRVPIFLRKINLARWVKIKAMNDKKRATKPSLWESLFIGV